MPKGIVIRADMKAQPEFSDFDNRADLEAVAGSPLKVVPIPQLEVAVVANAHGNQEGLPVNTYATLLWWFWVPALRRKVVLLGDVVVVGEPDPDGQPTNIPASFAGDVLSQHGHRVKLKVAGEKVVSDGGGCEELFRRDRPCLRPARPLARSRGGESRSARPARSMTPPAACTRSPSRYRNPRGLCRDAAPLQRAGVRRVCRLAFARGRTTCVALHENT